MAPRSAVAVVGSANVDLTTFTDAFPSPGETIFGRDFDLGFGGKGANQAVAARLCGARVSMVACVGDDLFGPATIHNFRKLDIDTTHVRIDETAASGVAPIFVDSSGENRIIVVKGANDHVSPADVDTAEKTLRAADFILLQFEIPLATIEHTIRRAAEWETRCLFNPAPAAPLKLDRLGGLDYFIPNQSEAAAISGRPCANRDEAEDCARFFLEAGIRRVIVTLGSAGALLASADGFEHVPAFVVETVDTTGAGDAFVGSLAAFLAEDETEQTALRKASLYAAMSTTGVGTQKSFPARERFDREWDRKN